MLPRVVALQVVYDSHVIVVGRFLREVDVAGVRAAAQSTTLVMRALFSEMIEHLAGALSEVRVLGMIDLLLYVVGVVVFHPEEQTVVHQIVLCEEFLVLLHDFLYFASVFLGEFEEELLSTLDLDILILQHGGGLDPLELCETPM